MKRFLARLLAIGLILILIGGVIFVIAFAASGWNFDNISGITYSSVTVTETDVGEINEIKIDFDTTDVKVNFDPEAKEVSITYPIKQNNKGMDLTTVQQRYENGMLALEEEGNSKINLYLWNFDLNNDNIITVTVPQSKIIGVDITLDTGDTAISGIGSLKYLKLETDTGDFNSENSTIAVTEKTSFKTDTGNIKLGKIDTASLYVETSTGDLHTMDVTVTDKINVECDTAYIYMNGTLTAAGIEIETDTGDVEGKKGLLNSPNIVITTDTGDVEIKIAGKKADYTVLTHTDTGDSNITNQVSGAKQLNISTDTGDIEVYFTE